MKKSTYNNRCPKCKKPYWYIRTSVEEAFVVGQEPYCCCANPICKTCGERCKSKKHE